MDELEDVNPNEFEEISLSVVLFAFVSFWVAVDLFIWFNIKIKIR